MTKGRLSNVVILTDHDANDMPGSIEIPGNVWLVFAKSYAPDLQKHVYGKMITRQFFYEDLE